MKNGRTKNIAMARQCNKFRRHFGIRQCVRPWVQKLHFSEYRIVQRPTNIIEVLLNLFHSGASIKKRKRVIVWITQNSFVTEDSGFWRDEMPLQKQDRWDHHFCAVFSQTNFNQCCIGLSIFATTAEEAQKSMILLAGLENTSCKCVSIKRGDHYLLSHRRCQFPLDDVGQLHGTATDICGMEFEKEEHEMMLARFLLAGGDLTLDSCTFLQGGKHFVDLLVEKGSRDCRFSMGIRGSNPFSSVEWIRFLDELKRSRYRCSELTLESVALGGCRALTALTRVKVGKLHLLMCTISTPGSVNSCGPLAPEGGGGPKSLVLHPSWIKTRDDSDGSGEQMKEWISFVTAFLNANQLEYLEVGLCRHLTSEVLLPFLRAFRDNTSLKGLAMKGELLSHQSCLYFVEAMCNHPSLEDVTLPTTQYSSISQMTHRLERTKVVTEMVLASDSLTECCQFDVSWWDPLRDCKLWENTLLPKLDCNKYRRMCNMLKTGASLVGRAEVLLLLLPNILAGVSEKPSVVHMLISQNIDTVVTGIDFRGSVHG